MTLSVRQLEKRKLWTIKFIKVEGTQVMKTAYSAGISALLFLIFFLAASSCFGREDRDLEDLIRRSMAAFDQVKDYRCTFHKKELVQGKLRSDRNITFKFHKPASFYLGYNEGDNKGREVIYVEGKYDGKLKVHQGDSRDVVYLSSN